MVNLDHVMSFPIQEYCGDTLVGDYICLFNSNKISSDDAIDVARSYEYNPYVLKVDKKTFYFLFYDKDKLEE